MGLGFTVGFFGILVLFHAAYSTIQCNLSFKKSVIHFLYWNSCLEEKSADFCLYIEYQFWFVADRGFLKITEEEFSGPPVNVSIAPYCSWASFGLITADRF